MNDSVAEVHLPPPEGEPGSGLSAGAAEAEVPAGTGAGGGDGPAAPAPLGVERGPTGNAEVDDRLRRLADADHLATDGHIAVYEDVHRGLRDALTALDARPGAAPQSPRPHDFRS
ncbi:hypothetical protein GCM10010145_69520 [Streptomyces ruber]|uniref:Uncharacterized protein n=2 Tax=Streptomyces TaxID=1883 RepID=A0A918F0V7_9ACTN|nr:hypothetical protein [Streptomyces ruber]GGQ90260.1 hypothetical protein GCM10010145_69520 [Streptomyces ruber]